MCCSRSKLSQHCRVNRQKSTRLFSGDRFGCSHCLCVAVGGIRHFHVCISMSYIFYFFYSDSLPSTGTLNNGSTVPTVVHQKKVLLFLPTSPLPPFVRCSWSPQWWSSPLLERASAHPSGWSLMRQGHQWKGSTHPHSLSQNRWLRYGCFTADLSGKSQLTRHYSFFAHTGDKNKKREKIIFPEGS